MAAVAAVLLFVAGVVYFLFHSVLSGMFAPPERYSVPKLEGQSYEEVVTNQELLGRFTLVLGETVIDDTVEPGTILKQEPAADSEVGPEITEIKVTISGKSERLLMIELYNMEYREAILALRDLGLKKTPIMEYAYDDEVTKGHIISFTPMKDAPVEPDTEVRMVISKGPETKTVVLSSFVDMTLENAKSSIDFLNLEVGEVKELFSDTVPAGKVISQYPTATTVVEEGSKVNLQVSKGVDPETLPKDVTKTIQIDLPPYEEKVNVQVLMDGKLVYGEDVDTALESVSFEITASGTKTFSVYVNGTLDHTFVEEFNR